MELGTGLTVGTFRPPDESGGYVQETPTESQEKQERSVVAHQDQTCLKRCKPVGLTCT